MAKISWNRKLLWLALIGIILYTGVIAISNGSSSGNDAENQPVPGIPSITKQEAESAAVTFLQQEYGIDGPMRTFVTYQTHKTISGYLQKEKLAELYDKQFSRLYPLDYFEVEAVDPDDGAIYYTDVNFNNSQIVAWSKQQSTALRKTIETSGQDRKKIAEQALVKRNLGLADFQLLKQSGADGALIFESQSQRIGDAPLRIRINVAGGAVTGFQPLYEAPSSYSAWQEDQDDSASWMTRISLLFTLFMALAAAVEVVKQRRFITFRHGVVLTVIFCAVYVANNINMYPSYKTISGTHLSGWEAISSLFVMNFVVFLMAASIYVSLLAGREMWLGHGWNAWPHRDSRMFGQEVLNGMGRGYLLCLFVLGVQQLLFFIAEKQFHVWAVNDPSDSVYNMLAPGLFPLMAWAAAISEEAVYRLFGIALFQRIVRNRFAAVLLPSMIWALSHTQYPIYPVYTRFIEVTIIGLIFGYAFLRYGFITVVFAHASMDSILMGLSLIDDGSAGDIATALFYMLLPGIVALVIAHFHRKRKSPFPRRHPDDR
ncbi:CPBP family intramembrane glutamic endopeptidase [Paenibacillus thalictri]|uniref:CPBP family intramembrane metalloprotease n=1 Tax=Paenibacillus thalictri TaxID=2527873 RepID=A0A4Q9DJ98_9BACL|nr:CPBP family intramembrane glutamic endopeptidase [Paenibacillus thalictri]TBL71503.1 CPBP family intramembrane metalloprotease [Paenibacillus thalictri]